MNRPSTRASAVAIVLPWILALAGFAFAVLWLRGSSPLQGGGSIAATDSQQIATLKIALASANATNEALRIELDRLRLASTGIAGIQRDASDPLAQQAGATKGAAPDQGEIGKRLKNALARSASGDAAAKSEAAKLIWELLRSGEGSAAALRDIYLDTADAQNRKLLLGSMMFAGSPETKDFIIDQVHSEKDPQLRQMLMAQTAKYATGEMAGALAPTFIQSIDSGEDPRVRIAAIRGLRFAPGTDAPQALARAAADPADDVRIAAIDVLASRPSNEETLRRLATSDPSARVREFAQCRMLVAKEAH